MSDVMTLSNTKDMQATGTYIFFFISYTVTYNANSASKHGLVFSARDEQIILIALPDSTRVGGTGDNDERTAIVTIPLDCGAFIKARRGSG